MPMSMLSRSLDLDLRDDVKDRVEGDVEKFLCIPR